MANSQTAIMRPLGGLARAFAAVQSRLYQAPPVTIAGVSEQNWPSALQPVQPVGPPGSQPLLWSFYQGINQYITPRPDAELSFQDLRGLATYPLARICIENIKDQLSSLKWTFQLKEVAGESLKQRRQRQENDKTIPMLAEFFAFPDGETPWSDWVRPLLEDLLVIDAACILVQRTLSGKVIKLRVPDGADILRLIDDQGYTPAPPSPAFTQLWEGIPRVLLTTDQLVYRPRNIVRRGTVASQLYGFGPTEGIKTELQCGIERLRYVLAYYTDGSVPGIVQMVPPGVSVDAILEGMQWMNSEMAGQLAKRRQWRNVQSYSGNIGDGPKDQIHQLKEPILADVYDDLHIRKVAFAYGASAQRLLRMMNRASAQAGQEAAQEEGTIPWVQWLKETLNVIIQRQFKLSAYEAIPDTAVELDPTKQMEIDTGYVKSGVFTINERRDMRGAEPRPEPEANGLMVITATGAIPLAGAIERTNEQHEADILPAPTPVIAPPGGGPQPKPKPAAKVVINGAIYDQPDNEELLAKWIENIGDISKKKDSDAVSIQPHPHTPQLALAKTKLYSHVAHFLFEAGKKASTVRLEKRKRHNEFTIRDESGKKVLYAMKATNPRPEDIDELVRAALASVNWEAFVDLAEPELEAAAVEGARFGLEELGVLPAAGVVPTTEIQALISEVNATARDWARKRAAEMVGMKYVDGELVENPNAKWRIDQATRNMLQRDITEAFAAETPISDLAATIRSSGAFSESRADLIATTEVSNAQMRGNAESWLKNGNVEEFDWQLSADHVCCDICDIFAMNSPHPIGKLLELLDQKHPRCQCNTVATKIKGVSL